jgi:hypothetical protein
LLLIGKKEKETLFEIRAAKSDEPLSHGRADFVQSARPRKSE